MSKNFFDVMFDGLEESGLLASERHDLFGEVKADNSTFGFAKEHAERREDGVFVYSWAAEDYANMLAAFAVTKGGCA